MIHHWKGLELRSQILNITMIGHPQLKLYHLKPQTLELVEIIKVSKNLHKIHQRKVLELEITDFDYQHDRTPSAITIPSQISNR